MKILIKKASDYNFKEIREVKPHNLVKLIDEFNCPIVIDKIMKEGVEFTGKVVNGKNELKSIGFINYEITIYDGYLE